MTHDYNDEELSISDVTLIARLRNTPNWMREGFQNWKDNVRTYDTAPFEAADRIEQLVATNEALTKERDQWISHAKTAIWSDSEELKETERKLAKAVEALRPFAEVLKGNYSHQSDGLPISMGHGKDDLRWVLPLGKFRLARATIAEIKSGVATTPYGLEGESHD